jgi:hypothetical protein
MIVMLALLVPEHAAAAVNGSPGIENTPLDMVVLVDESGSESPADIQHEIQAAGTIAQTPLNPRSRVTVVGFGGADGAAPNQNPVDVVCQPTVTNGVANLEYLARCVAKLHGRTPTEGNNTDYASALSQALSVLGPGTSLGQQSPQGAIKVILMMTDGGLSLPGDPLLPQPDWLPSAKHQVDLQLAAAATAGVEVWPLGFGSISTSNASYLQYLAAHGGQITCDSRGASRPHSMVAQDSAAALSDLYALYAAAGCFGRSNGGSAMVPGGQSRSLTVNIPPIASSGAISVDKGNPGIRVDFLTPTGTEVTGGSLGKSTVQFSGQDTAVEVLHITDPQSGPWQIKLTAPNGLGSQLVSATAFWQGAVRISILAAPPSARTGQRISLTVSVLGVSGPITEPSQLSGVQVQATVTGDGLPGPMSVPLAQASGTGGSGLTASDYIGGFTAPSTAGALVFTGTAAGYGLHATEVPAYVSVGGPATSMQATVQFTAPDTVYSGQAIDGKIFFNNKTGQSQRVRLAVSAAPALVTIAAPPGDLTVPSGTSASPFSVVLARNTPLGSTSIVLRAVDARQPTVTYGNQQLIVAVREPPGLVDKYRWVIIGLGVLVLLAVAGLCVLRVRKKRAIDPRGLSVLLRRDGEQLGPELPAPSKQASDFRFVIRDEEKPAARLDYPLPHDLVYVASRIGHGQVRVRTPAGVRYMTTPGSDGEPLPSGIRVAFRDLRSEPVNHKFTGGDGAEQHGYAPEPEPETDDWLQ